MAEETRTPFVLIVEDDRDIAALFRDIMEKGGYRTEIAVNGNIALEYIFKNPPDILLLDLSLPGVSGREILKIIGANKRFRNIHTVVITGYAQMANDLQVETDLVLEKPVSPIQLTELVNRLVQNDKRLQKRPLLKNPNDKVTGLYNRSFFTNRLEGALSEYQDNPEYLFGVMLVKAIRGKSPDAGDLPPINQASYLNEIARSIRSCLRPTDTIARFDNDNFFILVENVPTAKKVAEIAQRVQSVLLTHMGAENPFNIVTRFSDDNMVEVDQILGQLELHSVN